MGVRGKLEAVIYAAEEPVTLQQLVALFGEEALAEKAAATSLSESLPQAAWVGLSDVDEAQTAVPEPAEAQTLAVATGFDAQPQAPNNDPDEPLSAGEPGVHPDVQPDIQPGVQPDIHGHKRAVRLRDREARDELCRILAVLMAEYDSGDRGMEIREIAGGYRIATKPEYHDAVRAFAKSLKPPMKLTLQALETLAVIAYKQPVTAPEVSEIRGVDSGGVLASLMGRKLVTTAGRKQVIGRPILYKTTKEFLLRFGLKDIAELPSMEEFEKMAGELQALGDETAMPEKMTPLPAPLGATSSHEDLTEANAATPSIADENSFALAGEKPKLAPSEITISVAEPEHAGVSVNKSGIALADLPEPNGRTGN